MYGLQGVGPSVCALTTLCNPYVAAVPFQLACLFPSILYYLYWFCLVPCSNPECPKSGSSRNSDPKLRIRNLGEEQVICSTSTQLYELVLQLHHLPDLTCLVLRNLTPLPQSPKTLNPRHNTRHVY